MFALDHPMNKKQKCLILCGCMFFLFSFAYSGYSFEDSLPETQIARSILGSDNASTLLNSSTNDTEQRRAQQRETEGDAFEGTAVAKPDAIIEGQENRDGSTTSFARLRRAELFSLGTQVAGMSLLQAVDAWHTGHRPFAKAGKNLRRAWTSAPTKDTDSYFYNYIGHPYTGSFTYNLMRSQKASPLTSWLFSCSQSLVWEFTFEATEQQPSIQDLLLTSNLGSLIGEGAHWMTARLKKNGMSRKEKILVLLINPGHVLMNGFR